MVAVLVLAFIEACNRSSRPTQSSPHLTAPTTTSPHPTVTGIVAEGSRPIEGAQVDNGYGAGAWAFSDSNGVFQLPFTSSIDPHGFVRAGKAGYVQPCAAPINDSGRVRVQMVSLTVLRGTPLPSAPGSRTISGVVMIPTGSEKQPAAKQPRLLLSSPTPGSRNLSRGARFRYIRGTA
jgi:hypothetical protein